MIRILSFVAVILAIGFGLSWLADRPGQLLLTWQGQQVETSLLVGIAAVAAVVLAVMVVWWLLRSIFTSPDRMKRYFRTRRKDRGYKALSVGLIAAGAGDAALARKMTHRTRGLLTAEDEPLIHVLEAQTYMIEGRHDEARAKFEAMAENPETRELGLRGLYLEARRLEADEAAEHYAERAAERAPHLPWAGRAALEYRTKNRNWDDALRLLDRQRATRMLARLEADRKKAVLLTARAMDVLESDPRQAASDAQAALKLAPGLVPAAITAAKALFRLNDLRRGSKILETVWKANPHPDVADTYVRARVGDSVQDRLKRAQKLEALKPNHAESLRVVASAALDAHEHKTARDKAEAALRQQPREGLYLLLADIEEADTGDEGRVRHWMSQAVKAPRDPAWTADGYVAREWAPVSPVTGEIDAFVWKVPVKELLVPEIEGGAAQPATNDPDEAIRSLPPVKAAEPASSAPVAGQKSDETSARKPIDIEGDTERTTEKATIAPAPTASQVSPSKAPASSAPGDVTPAPVVSPAPAPVAAGSERMEAAVQATSVSEAPADAASAKAGSGAVIIPLQSQNPPKTTAAPPKVAQAEEEKKGAQIADRSAEGSKPKWYQKPPLVIEPHERATTMDAHQEETAASERDHDEGSPALQRTQNLSRSEGGRPAAADPRHAERAADKQRAVADESASSGKSAFRGQPVDDPGVDEQADESFTARSSSRFRLF